MSLNSIELLENGIYVEAVVEKEIFLNLLKRLYPVKSEFDLIRIGGVNDGGYLLPNDFQGISACFSPGVADNASFEFDLFKKTGIESHLADYSVEGPPNGFQPKSFLKKYLGSINNDIYITLDSWIETKENSSNTDFILQMDIEGAEYLTLLNTNIKNIKKFRILVLEFHNIYAWSQKNFFGIIDGLFDKILQYFYVVHNHPNNNDGVLNINGVEVPRTLELTLIRKDRTSLMGFRNDFPHIFDRPNQINIPDQVLPQSWFKSKNYDAKQKLLLCRPQGGWNDLFCSIEKCWEYAAKFNRKLIIDSSHSGIKDHFWKYFEVKDPSELVNYSLEYLNFDNLNTFPKCIQGRVSNFVCEYSMDKRGFVDTQSKELICFDNNLDYDDQLLVHEQGWLDKEMGSINLMTRINFTNPIKDEIKERISHLPENYVAIHIRHTDYTTNYEKLIEIISENVKDQNVLICSDNYQVIQFVKKKLINSTLYRLSKFEDNNGRHLHYSAVNIYENNIESLTDLIAMALADKIYFTNVNETPRPSGFSMLAQALSNRKALVKSLIY